MCSVFASPTSAEGWGRDVFLYLFWAMLVFCNFITVTFIYLFFVVLSIYIVVVILCIIFLTLRQVM